ncbi:MAG: alpha/beta hydrolase family protein [Bacteroidota bacterium]
MTVSVHKQTGAIDSTQGDPIRYDLYLPANTTRSVLPVVLFLHGFKGFKDWGPFPSACEDLAANGLAVLAFNFSLNGIGEDPLELDRLDLFEKSTLSQDLEDTGRVIDAIRTGAIASSRARLNSDIMAVIGHSRGGHTAVAAAAEYDEIQSLVTWSAVADYNRRWSEKMKEDWETRGWTVILNGRTGQEMKLSRKVYDDALTNADRLMAIRRVRDLYLPSLFIAGKEDEAVPWTDSRELYRACPSTEKELHLIPDTGHTFGASHPFEEVSYPEPFEELMDQTGSWLVDTLL